MVVADDGEGAFVRLDRWDSLNGTEDQYRIETGLTAQPDHIVRPRTFQTPSSSESLCSSISRSPLDGQQQNLTLAS